MFYPVAAIPCFEAFSLVTPASQAVSAGLKTGLSG